MKPLCKIQTQQGIIIKKMLEFSYEWFTIGDFCGTIPDAFVGYKAAQRMCELQKKNLVVSRWSDLKTALGGSVKEYKLNTEFFTFNFSDKEIFVSEKPMSEIAQQKLF